MINPFIQVTVLFALLLPLKQYEKGAAVFGFILSLA